MSKFILTSQPEENPVDNKTTSALLVLAFRSTSSLLVCTQTQDNHVFLALPSGHALWTEVQVSLNLLSMNNKATV